jgi:hypothetical protein
MMSELKHLTIDPEKYNSRDIETLSDLIGDILAEEYGEIVGSLSFSIDVSYTTIEDEELATD